MSSADNLKKIFEAAQCPLSEDQESILAGAMAFHDAAIRKDKERLNFIAGMWGDGREADIVAIKMASALSIGLRGIEALDCAMGL